MPHGRVCCNKLIIQPYSNKPENCMKALIPTKQEQELPVHGGDSCISLNVAGCEYSHHSTLSLRSTDVLMHVRILQTINNRKKHYVFKPAEQFHMPWSHTEIGHCHSQRGSASTDRQASLSPEGWGSPALTVSLGLHTTVILAQECQVQARTSL